APVLEYFWELVLILWLQMVLEYDPYFGWVGQGVAAIEIGVGMVDLRVGVDLVVAAGTSVWSMGGAGVFFVEVASWVGLVVLGRLINGGWN
ncbi:hypothetical protein HN51_047855, partial [Arachis hypogaea]